MVLGGMAERATSAPSAAGGGMGDGGAVEDCAVGGQAVVFASKSC